MRLAGLDIDDLDGCVAKPRIVARLLHGTLRLNATRQDRANPGQS